MILGYFIFVEFRRYLDFNIQVFHSMSCIIFLLWLPFLAFEYAISMSSKCTNQHFLFEWNLQSPSLLHFGTSWMWNIFICFLKEFLFLNFCSQNLHLKLGSKFLIDSLWRNQQFSPYQQLFSKKLTQSWTLLVWFILLCCMTSSNVPKLLSQNLQSTCGLGTSGRRCSRSPLGGWLATT